MSMTITLDTQALLKLIADEGDAFKVELKKAVVANAAASWRIAMRDDDFRLIGNALIEEATKTGDAAFGALKSSYNGGRRFELKPEIAKAIQVQADAAAKRAVEGIITNLDTFMNEHITEARAELMGRVETMIDGKVTKWTSHKIEELVVERLNAVLAATRVS